MSQREQLHGVGLGLRRDLHRFLLREDPPPLAFVECAPENWMDIGGYWARALREIVERYPLLTHGLSLSLGSAEPLNFDFLAAVKKFLDCFDVRLYSEHLSYTKTGNAHLFELLPIPFREDAVRRAVARIGEVQDFLGREIAIENVSYYLPLEPEMDEATFISAIVRESGCGLLLDVNNVYVNSINHRYDPKAFIAALPLDRVRYMHMAGHERVSDDFAIDTHGAPIVDPVFELYSWTLERVPPVPVLLERDFNIPAGEALLEEVTELSRRYESVNAGRVLRAAEEPSHPAPDSPALCGPTEARCVHG